jgi:hypothetical protein
MDMYTETPMNTDVVSSSSTTGRDSRSAVLNGDRSTDIAVMIITLITAAATIWVQNGPSSAQR